MKPAILVVPVLLLASYVPNTPSAYSQRRTNRPAAQSRGALTVSHFIQAIQSKDYKVLVDSSYQYQAELSSIKARNPKVLWPKLETDYYAEKTSQLTKSLSYWQAYGQTLASMTGDPASNIRAVFALLPASCKWAISESKTQQVSSVLSGPYLQTLVYVTVTYVSLAESPVVDTRPLKQAILAFELRDTRALFLGVSRIPAGDVFWPTPQLTEAAALELARLQLPKTLIHAHIMLQINTANRGTSGSPIYYIWPLQDTPTGPRWESVKRILANALRSRDCTVEIGREDEIILRPPASWSKYQIQWGSNEFNNDTNGEYALEESFDFTEVTVKQTENSVSTRVKARRVGCNLVCETAKQISNIDLLREVDTRLLGGFLQYNEVNNVWPLRQYHWPEAISVIADYRWEGVKGWVLTNVQRLAD